MAYSDISLANSAALTKPTAAVPAPILDPESGQAEAQTQAQEFSAMSDQVAELSGGQPVPPAALGEQIDPATGTLVPSPLMMLANSMPPPEEQGAPQEAAPPEQKSAIDRMVEYGIPRTDLILKLALDYARHKSARKKDLADYLVWDPAPERPKPEPRRKIRKKRKKKEEEQVVVEKTAAIGKALRTLVGGGRKSMTSGGARGLLGKVRTPGPTPLRSRTSTLHTPPPGNLKTTATARPKPTGPGSPTVVVPGGGKNIPVSTGFKNNQLEQTFVTPSNRPTATAVNHGNPYGFNPRAYPETYPRSLLPDRLRTQTPLNPSDNFPQYGFNLSPRQKALFGLSTGAALSTSVYYGVQSAPYAAEVASDFARDFTTPTPVPPPQTPSYSDPWTTAGEPRPLY